MGVALVQQRQRRLHIRSHVAREPVLPMGLQHCVSKQTPAWSPRNQMWLRLRLPKCLNVELRWPPSFGRRQRVPDSHQVASLVDVKLLPEYGLCGS